MDGEEMQLSNKVYTEMDTEFELEWQKSKERRIDTVVLR